MRLVLLRHGESEWNRLNLFTGWTDVELSEKGRTEAASAGELMKAEGLDFDICYTSFLKRAIHTLNGALQAMDREWLPVVKAWELNERHYGALQGLNKSETAEKYGEDQVKVWRRSYATPPPELSPEDERSPANQEMFRTVPRECLPLTESLKDTVARAAPYFEKEIKPRMLAGDRVLIAAHGNSLRALVRRAAGVRVRLRFQRRVQEVPGRPGRHWGQDGRRCEPGQEAVNLFRGRPPIFIHYHIGLDDAVGCRTGPVPGPDANCLSI